MCLSYAECFSFNCEPQADRDSDSDFTNLKNNRGDRQSDHINENKNHNERLEEKVHGPVSI